MTEVGLGQAYDSMRLARTSQAWLAAGAELRSRVAHVLAGITSHVEVIGSSSVLGLLAKPIIDLAVGLAADQPLAPATTKLEADGWNYRGDAGADGGHVFVLEDRPWHRVAHLHVVEYDGDQWRDYLSLRDLLRHNPVARERYEAVKLELAQRTPIDRKAYTRAKVRSLHHSYTDSSERPIRPLCDPGRTEPTALVLWACEPRDSTGIPAWENGLPAGGRLDLPTSMESQTWTFLGMLPDGEVAILRSGGDENTYVRVLKDGRLDPMYDLPADAQIVVPGGMIGD